METQALLMPLILQLTADSRSNTRASAGELQSIGLNRASRQTIAVRRSGGGAIGDLEKLIRNLEIADASSADYRWTTSGQHGRLDRLPRRHQDQHAARSQQDEWLLASLQRPIAHELSARPPIGCSTRTREISSLSSDLSLSTLFALDVGLGAIRGKSQQPGPSFPIRPGESNSCASHSHSSPGYRQPAYYKPEAPILNASI